MLHKKRKSYLKPCFDTQIFFDKDVMMLSNPAIDWNDGSDWNTYG